MGAEPMVSMVPRTVRLPGRIWNEVDALAVRDGVSSTEIIREAVIRLLEREQGPRTKKAPPKRG